MFGRKEKQFRIGRAYSKFMRALEKEDVNVKDVIRYFALDEKIWILQDLAKHLKFKLVKYKR